MDNGEHLEKQFNIIKRHMEEVSPGKKQFNLLNAISELDARMKTHELRLTKLEEAMQYIASEFEGYMSKQDGPKIITNIDVDTTKSITKERW